MFFVVTGGSASGKSEFAENLAVKYNTGNLIYLATMISYDKECDERIKKHRDLRKEKGFATIEHYTNLKSLKLEGRPTILLECMSNLLANEMFSEQGIGLNQGRDFVHEEILKGIKHLVEQCEHVVVVTNEVFSDYGSSYNETMEYLKCLGSINQGMSAIANDVYEVVCGIPMKLKVER